MRSLLIAIAAVSVACSSYSMTNVIEPDDDGFAGATSSTSQVNGQSGIVSMWSSYAPNGGATTVATGGATEVGATSASGGTSENSALVNTSGTSFTTVGVGGTSTSTAIASGGIATGGASTTVANECSAIYAQCGAERTCTDFIRTQYGSCSGGSFFCGKYVVWYYDGGPVSACNHTEKGCSPAPELDDYYEKSCNAGTGGSPGTTKQASGGNAASVGSSSPSGGSSASSTIADCSNRNTYVTCKYCGAVESRVKCTYKNDPSDPMECSADANVGAACGTSFAAACDGKPGGSECWNACVACGQYGADSSQCRAALLSVPADSRPCSTTYPETN